MIFDNYLTFDDKVKISMLASIIWIYFRTAECYKLIPRKSIVSVLLVTTWVYLNYQEPLFLPIGLIILYLYGLLF